MCEFKFKGSVPLATIHDSQERTAVAVHNAGTVIGPVGGEASSA